ncbi:MAG: tRNA (adenosine(37)-N6)-threonylcarbamoyltransferase complex ATPase subunit type 1 TsaE [Candidatus Kerfeldbacteria bacterium]|nr:tRNA (adenosine(37)-N6)-threonylcarbamoyltransferase complex ATPase subunit type 1 TsaE [Candidatus Kerfeldbacteria bacterium]
MARSVTVTTDSPAATRRLAAALGRAARAGEIVALTGGLGSGKTTFAQALARAAGVRSRLRSPTFVIAASYRTGRQLARQLHHLDLYRLRRLSVTDTATVTEVLGDRQAIIIVEWADRLDRRQLPRNRTTFLNFRVRVNHRRVIRVVGRLSRFVPVGPGRRPLGGSADRAGPRCRSA